MTALAQIEGDDRDRANRHTYRGLRAPNRRRVTDQLLQEVADIYLGAQDSGHPTKAVKDHFGLATATASLYVRRARDAGYLPPPPRNASSREPGAESNGHA